MTRPIPLARGKAAPPVRIVHIGLGSFFRAHQAWYTAHAPDADGWGIAAFSGRRAELAETLRAQGGLYTLVTRAADGDRFEVVPSLSAAHTAAEHDRWLDLVTSPQVSVVTLTVTEAGYLRDGTGGLDRAHPAVRADIEALKGDRHAPVRTAPARLVAGLLARARAGVGPLAVVPCDNLPGNAGALARVVRELTAAVDPGFDVDAQAAFVSTVVDRITPATTDAERRTVRDAGFLDDAPVVTEPFSEWILAGAFPGGLPAWEAAGATFTDDVGPFEQRKLWLLNGAHSLLAYAGSARGHATVAEAVADDTCRGWVEAWWSEASRHLALPVDAVAAYRTALLERFANPRIRHRLDQIAADGSQKLPVRVVPVLRAERAAGRLPLGACRVLSGWISHLRGAGVPVTDVEGARLADLADAPLGDAVPRLLAELDPALADDPQVTSAVLALAEETEDLAHP